MLEDARVAVRDFLRRFSKTSRKDMPYGNAEMLLEKERKAKKEEREEKRQLLLPILNLAGLVFVIAVNGLAQTELFGDKTTGELSDQYPNLFTPAGWAFSIWSLIYLALGFFVVRSFFRALKGRLVPTVTRIGTWFLISCLANVGWIQFWHMEHVAAALGAMLVLLFSLVKIHTKIGIAMRPIGAWDFITYFLPFSLYLGWITVATATNFVVLFVEYEFSGLGLDAETWAVSLIFITSLIGGVLSILRWDFVYALVIVWALMAIYSKRVAEGVAVETVGNTALIAGLAMAGVAIASFVIWKRRT